MTSQPIINARLTYAEAAVLMGRSVSWVEKRVRQEEIPFHRIGHSIRFDKRELLDWMDDHQETDNRIKPVHPLKKRPGQRYVYPSQQLGDFEHCWCGEQMNHDWPGKEIGKPHPHDHEGIQQVVMVQSETQSEHPMIERKALRGYHSALRAFLMQCINVDGLRYRRSKSEVILYPPDDSRPISVYARNSDSQLRSLRQWYAQHVDPHRPEDVDASTVRRLAESVNDPVEHPVPEPEPELADIGEALEPEPESACPSCGSVAGYVEGPPCLTCHYEPEPDQVTNPPVTEGPVWVTYITDEGEEVPNFETNGVLYRCRECMGTSTEYVTDNRRGIGGHNRMSHRPTENLRSPEARAKALDSKRYNRLHEKVRVAVELLAETIEMTLPDAVEELKAENDTLRGQVAVLQALVDDSERRADDAELRADEAEAKLDRIRGDLS